MAGNVKVDMKQMEELQKKLNSMASGVSDEFIRDMAKEIAARLMRKVIKRTPVGQYPAESGMTGGTLRRNWTVSDVVRKGNEYVIEVFNPVEYSVYVEYGHRQTPGRFVPAIGKRLKQSWVPGKFMMTISAKEVENLTPALLQKRFEQKIREVLND